MIYRRLVRSRSFPYCTYLAGVWLGFSANDDYDGILGEGDQTLFHTSRFS